jgi:DNA-directed RNA polymerase subunit beta'
MVITPLGSEYTMDDCMLPYKASVELFKPLIIRKLAKLKGISSVKAEAIWLQAVLKFSPVVYKIMADIIKKPNVNILINRNPTIAIGSILLLRIAGIKKDVDDLTTSIHNLILSPLSADYDGDVLNFILIMSNRFSDMFDAFRPHNLLVDSDSGNFNGSFLPAKDTLLGLASLFSQ